MGLHPGANGSATGNHTPHLTLDHVSAMSEAASHASIELLDQEAPIGYDLFAGYERRSAAEQEGYDLGDLAGRGKASLRGVRRWVFAEQSGSIPRRTIGVRT